MLSKFYESRFRIRSLRKSPALPQLESFAQALWETGYGVRTARQHLCAAEHIIYWTHSQGTPVPLNEQSLTRFERHLSRCHCPSYGRMDRRSLVRGACLFLTYLREDRITTKRSTKPAVHEPALLSAFCQWMRQQRGVCDVTLRSYRIYIRELLQRMGEEPSRFHARRLRAFVLEKAHSWGRSKNCVTVLRMFLRFLIAEGQCAVGLDAAIPTAAHWRLASLPRYLPPKDVERLIASCDRGSAVGRRDRAILLLLARLGLRAGDIANLRVSDIDWEGASIQVCGKGRCHTRLPLSQEVGQAIVAYLKNGRPQTSIDAVFISSLAPRHPFGSGGAISDIVKRALRRAGVVRPNRGAAHLLRHSLATSLLRQGTSLQDIAAILRHRSIETTQIYAKVDICSLRQIAQPWQEV